MSDETDIVATKLRHEVFTMFADIEQQLKLTFFAIVLCPGTYIYHKLDSVEFSMALMGQANAAIEMSDYEADDADNDGPGPLQHSHSGVLRYKWWTPVRKKMQKLSDTRGWRWFVVVMENTKRVMVTESANFPLSSAMREHLLEVVDVLWQESQLADISSADDNFQRSCAEVAFAAADQLFPECVGIERI